MALVVRDKEIPRGKREENKETRGEKKQKEQRKQKKQKGGPLSQPPDKGSRDSSSHTTRTIMHAAPHIHMANGKALQASASAIKTSNIPVIKRQRQNWLDASDDGFFIATEETSFLSTVGTADQTKVSVVITTLSPVQRRKIRKKFTRSQLKRASRTPCSPIIAKTKSLMNNRQARSEPGPIIH
ncbi:hypothetical protein DUI87_09975 [Hirundo rustica rustica]|uniref:Uncharacterized protein n=1 Tax=Hirundo rustica rustica TaxID=333673 RepID=A0A3M0KGT1_HIRRU|nr:hypothetical protein DUI87_09975 [Hirundo rustica rustica]